MFRKMKKAVVLIPCMIFAFFLFNGTKAMAGNAKLTGAEIITIGNSNKENTYYFTKDSIWEFETDYQIITDEIFLKWRVVRPDGRATAWSDKTPHIKQKGKFIISDYKSLSYTTSDDKSSSRFSVVPENTYYVDIMYYDQILWPIHKEKRDETIKIVVVGDSAAMTPLANISYDASNNQFSLSASFAQAGQNLISSVQYLFASNSTVITNPDEFQAAYADKAITNKYIETVNSQTYAKTIDSDSTADKLYFLVSTPHGYETLVSYDMTSNQGGNSVTQTPSSNGQQNTSTNDDKGLFDYDFGQLILIVLVVVLVVSCALIITQKIVDYKKRLY